MTAISIKGEHGSLIIQNVGYENSDIKTDKSWLHATVELIVGSFSGRYDLSLKYSLSKLKPYKKGH